MMFSFNILLILKLLNVTAAHNKTVHTASIWYLKWILKFQECYTEAMNIPGMLHMMLLYRSHEHPRNVIQDAVLQKPWTSQECYIGCCFTEAMDIPGMLEDFVLQKPWTFQECSTGFCSIEAMDIPGMLQRMLFYRSHGHPRNVTQDFVL